MMPYSRPKLPDFYTLSPFLKLNWLKTMLFRLCDTYLYIPQRRVLFHCIKTVHPGGDGIMSQILFTDVKIIYLFSVLNYRNRGKSVKKVPSLKRDLDARALSESYR